MNQVAAIKATGPRETQIANEVQNLHTEAQEAVAATRNLASMLAKVVRDEPSQDEKTTACPGDPRELVPLAMEIRSATLAFRQITRETNEVMRKLEL